MTETITLESLRTIQKELEDAINSMIEKTTEATGCRVVVFQGMSYDGKSGQVQVEVKL